MNDRKPQSQLALFAAAILTLSCIADAQTGRGIQLEKAAVSNSGGSAAAGTFLIESTTGQALLGVAAGGGSFVATFGF